MQRLQAVQALLDDSHGGFGSVNRSGEGGLALEGASQGFGFRGSFTGRHSDDVNTPAGELFELSQALC